MTIESHPETYGAAAGMPPLAPLAPGPVYPVGTSPVSGVAAGFGLATNADLPDTNAEVTADDADRRAHAADAAAKFPANEAESAQQLQSLGTEQMAQMIPQMAQGLAGALGGAFGGALGPLTQLPQQAMQAGQSAIQPLMSAVQNAGSAGPGSGIGDGLGEFGDAELVDSVDGGGGAGDVGGGTTPTGFLGPPPVPTSSPPTTPAGAPTKSVTATPADGTPPLGGARGMTGMPMVPPGAMGAGGKDGSKDKPGDKRVAAPGVPNGQPVKGRLTTPPNVPVTKSAEGKPVVRRRILLPEHREHGRIVADEKTDGVE